MPTKELTKREVVSDIVPNLNVHHFVNGAKVAGKHANISAIHDLAIGDCTNVTGDCSQAWGDYTGKSGDFTNVRGDVTAIKGTVNITGYVGRVWGIVTNVYGQVSPKASGEISENLSGNITGVEEDFTGIEGNLDACNLTVDDRAQGVKISTLVNDAVAEEPIIG